MYLYQARPPASVTFPTTRLPTVGEVEQTRRNDVIPRTLSFFSFSFSPPVLYKHSCLWGMLAWENINHPHEWPFFSTTHPFLLNVGDWNAFSPADPLSSCLQCQAFQLAGWSLGDRAQEPCKTLKARQKLWLQVTPETTCGRFLEECKVERRATVLGWGMQGRGWGVGWMQAFTGLSALPTKLPASGKPRGTKQRWWALWTRA